MITNINEFKQSLNENKFSHTDEKFNSTQIEHNFFPEENGFIIQYENKVMGLVYLNDDYWIAWSVDFDIANIKQFLDECVQGLHDTEGSSFTADTFEEAVDELLTDTISESTTGLEALPVSVYKSPLGDSSANGITSKTNRLLLVFDGLSSPFKTNENEDYLVLIKRNIGGKEYLHAKPQSLIDSNTHSMFGGNFIFTSDSRFPSPYPIPVHDRVEN